MAKRKTIDGVNEILRKSKKCDNTVLRSYIKSSFLINCPSDFFDFYEFCCSLLPEDPLSALSEELDLQLVGPFEILADKSLAKENCDLTCHYRFYHDPPELVTVFVSKSENQFHVGYFRDDHASVPTLMVSSDPSVSGRLEMLGSEIFSVVAQLLNRKKGAKRARVLTLMQKFAIDRSLRIDLKSKVKRDCVCPTLNGVGLQIHLNDGIGYRPVPLSNSELFNLFDRIVQATDEKTKLRHQADLDELVTLVQFANDEGDYGEGLELGLDLLAFHPKGVDLERVDHFNSTISMLLSVGYHLAGRHEFAKVIEKHMKERLIHPKTLRTTE